MFDALDVETREQFHFKSLDTLTRRYRGHTYHVRQDGGAYGEPRRQVQILRPNRKAGGHDILAVVSVPSEALDAG
jgi:hypothetical protein